MSIKVKLCKTVNGIFPLPVHPFNLQNDKVKSYAEWQFEKADDTIKFYLSKVSKKDMFEGKNVLDIGCGAAGKTLNYASCGVNKIVGVEVLEHYRTQAEEMAQQKGLDSKFTFVCADAADLPFESEIFDTIIMNDAMEHVDEPKKVLDECYRVLKPGGRLFVNFPPYYHPYGAHLSDMMGMPWIHLFFSEDTLIKTYKELAQKLPDGQNRINFRISTDKSGKEYFSYINKMTISRYATILQNTPFKLYYYNEVPLRGFLSPFTKLPVFKELFVKMVVCIFEK